MEKKENGISLVAYIILLIVLLVGVGVLVFFISQKPKEDNQQNCTGNNCTDTNTICDDPIVDLKPIIYLYPENETEVSVKLGKKENITCSYPKYENGWNVIAKPNGDLVEKETGRNLYSLYWEGLNSLTYKEDSFKEGFCVKGEDSAKFLEEKLEMLGLTQREAEEFIVYWLPKLESNKYNYVRFQTKEEIDENMPLEINPNPDTVIRVMMEFKGLDEEVDVQEQKLETPERKGFVAVEWGGTELK